jgi:hypothetical protein
MSANGKLVTGDCDCCERLNMTLTPSVHDVTMMMCEFCKANEATVTTARAVVETARQTDSAIVLKQDIWTATTTAFVELQGAILSNPDIPAEQKKYALAQEAAERIKKYDAVIFNKKKELAEIENERFGWVKNLQPLVATLRAEQQAPFKQYNLNYKPQSPGKSIKTTKAVKSTTTPKSAQFKYADIKAACAKHGVDISIVKMMMMSRNGLSPEAAASELASKRKQQQAN